MPQIASGILAIAVATALASCSGYRLGPTKPESLSHVQSLAIPTFVNETLEPRLAVPLTTATIQAFMMEGSYKIASHDHADAVLVVTIKEIRRSTARTLRGDRLVSKELDFTIDCDYYVEDLITGELLARGSASGTSNLGVDKANLQLAERQALTDAARVMAREIVSEVAEGW